jgi:hypothetical protein
MAAVIAAIAIITTILVSRSTCYLCVKYNYTPVTNYTSITMPSIAGLNATTIINAINAKIKLIYDEKSYNTTKPSK